eukprot:s2990_g11.t1
MITDSSEPLATPQISAASQVSTGDFPMLSVCAVKADVTPELRIGPAGWTLDSQHCGIGRHYSNHYQDPTLVRPQMNNANLSRTTLLRDQGEWHVLELCESFDSLIDLGAEFYNYEGPRDILTIITEGDKDPLVMGFRLLGDEEPLFSGDGKPDSSDSMAVVPDEVEGIDIEAVQLQQGAYVPLEGRLVVQSTPTDMVLVNGVELTAQSSLRALRAGLTFNGLSTSGSKQKCFDRLLNFQKQMELQTVHAAATAAQQELTRVPNAVELQQPPSEREQQLHNLSHLPYASWCPSCVAYRARSDRHERTGASQRSSVPSISFDCCYTKCVPDKSDSKDIDSITALLMIDSVSGYIQAVPLRNKNQWNLMVHELLSFAGLMGHSEVTFRCDNEPTLLQLQRMAINARLAMGLVTHKGSPPPYSKSNGLVENAVGRIRPLAGSLMHYMGQRIGVDFDTNSPWWSWALKHACWIYNRYGPSKGMSPYEIIHGKEFTGRTCCFGEPVFGLAKVEGKGTARWRRMIFLTKSETHDSYLLYEGTGLVLTRSIRRIDTNWKSHLAYCKSFPCWSFEYRSGFGSRVLPTKATKAALGASAAAPVGSVEPSPFVDEDAEAVKQKHLEEVREENEAQEMALHDKSLPQIETQEEPYSPSIAATEINMQEIFSDDGGSNKPDGPSASSASAGLQLPLDAPQTPQDGGDAAPTTPRTSPSTRLHAEEPDDHDSKRQRVESSKKTRLQRISSEHAAMVRMVKFADEEFPTMDDYQAEPSLDDHLTEDAWYD